jgi:hypothetical protein
MQKNEAGMKEKIADAKVPKAKAAKDREHEPRFFSQVGNLRPDPDEAGLEEDAENARGHGGGEGIDD